MMASETFDLQNQSDCLFIQALKNTGILESDLHYTSREAIRSQGVNNEFKNDIEYFLDVKENHMKERVDLLLL